MGSDPISKHVFCLLLSVLLGCHLIPNAMDSVSADEPFDGYISISVTNAWDLLSNTSNGLQIPIDVRTDSEWYSERIDTPFPEEPRHFNLFVMQTTEGLQQFFERYNGSEIVLYCMAGSRSLMASQLLVEKGFNGTIYNMLGGITSWKSAGLPTKTGNQPPEAPMEPLGPTVCSPGIQYLFSTCAVDPDNDTLRYGWDWDGDDIVDEWTSYYVSGTTMEISHTWMTSGVSIVQVLVEDNVGDQSNFSSSFSITVDSPPQLGQEYPDDGIDSVERPPDMLNISIEDKEGNPMDIMLRWKNHADQWVNLISSLSCSNGTYHYSPVGHDWIWGNTTYTWSVNVTDGIFWTNQTYTFITGGSRYDVNNDNSTNFIDAGIVWVHRTTNAVYDGIYDVNGDGTVNFVDAGLTWVNRD